MPRSRIYYIDRCTRSRSPRTHYSLAVQALHALSLSLLVSSSHCIRTRVCRVASSIGACGCSAAAARRRARIGCYCSYYCPLPQCRSLSLSLSLHTSTSSSSLYYAVLYLLAESLMAERDNPRDDDDATYLLLHSRRRSARGAAKLTLCLTFGGAGTLERPTRASSAMTAGTNNSSRACACVRSPD